MKHRTLSFSQMVHNRASLGYIKNMEIKTVQIDALHMQTLAVAESRSSMSEGFLSRYLDGNVDGFHAVTFPGGEALSIPTDNGRITVVRLGTVVRAHYGFSMIQSCLRDCYGL